MSTPQNFVLNNSDVARIALIAKKTGIASTSEVVRFALEKAASTLPKKVQPSDFEKDDSGTVTKQVRLDQFHDHKIARISRWIPIKRNGHERQMVKEMIVKEKAWKIDHKGQVWATKVKSRSGFRDIDRQRAEINQGGTLMVAATINGQQITCLARDLVWSFANNKSIPNGKRVVNKNGNLLDNRPSNLTLEDDVAASAAVRFAIRTVASQW